MRYSHDAEGSFLVESMRGPVAEICSSPEEQENSTVHLICAGPQLYESLKELLLATEDALMND